MPNPPGPTPINAGPGAVAILNSIASVSQALQGLAKVTGELVKVTPAATAALTSLGAAALPGGFTVLAQTVQYMTSIIGTVAVPVFGVVAAAGLTLADMFKDTLLSAAKAVATWFTENLIPAIKLVVDACSFLAEKFADTQQGLATGMAWIGEKLGLVEKGTTDVLRGDDIRARARQQQAQAAAPAGGGAAAPAGGGIMDKFVENFGSIVQSIRQGMAQQAKYGFSSLTEAAKQIQMQAFQSDMQKKLFDVQKSALDILESMLKEFQKGGLQPAVGGRP